MTISPLAGHRPPHTMLASIPGLVSAYYTEQPDPENPLQLVSFGTSGHRGSSLKGSFNEAHILAVSQAIAEFRTGKGINGPLFVGKDTHALSEPAFRTAVEVFAANGVETVVQEGGGYTPTPVISHAILGWNRDRTSGLADGVVVTPSHNPPEDGGFKYNPPSGGPADPEMTDRIQARANEILRSGGKGVRRIPFSSAMKSDTVRAMDYIAPYVNDLGAILDLQAIARSGVSIGADPMGGSGVAYWDVIASRYGLKLDVVNPVVDPTFSFMSVDWDGKIRMDCSSPYAMAGLVNLKDRYDIAFGNDTDFDRHGIVVPDRGLLAPNGYLAVAVDYLFTHRPGWRKDAAVGKTLVSSSLIDRVARSVGRKCVEVPVGFKWFVEGLLDGSLGFGGEESAGASFLRKDGTAWSTDKDGIILTLLAAEILAVTGEHPGIRYDGITARLGVPYYARIDAAAGPERRKLLKKLTPEAAEGDTLAGEPILAKLTEAPGNGAPIGGLKVTSENGWFAARPSGTEDVYKIYAESFLGEDHLRRIQEEARDMVDGVFARAGV
ncbi:phosphoglucomutase (alpha-D-glucose-1,6-bisphosphate-dependent) [Aminivibrio sp.]|uniref:phosphoglucomutase (alpha-D-glucose-1,6-bisphosphate-dependent) n=1 Tax=Aminivibrio sp. TaxID=1872489 RepID=UPI00345F113C|nr:phosphoglucomutase (alpha-D-glucose-1,6-bisphosphate-dependent) [Synergistaceae bacterium]NCB16080.1 alpha-D-glucose phosphate-specific phosphoglucomutase [Synergistales bacterium]